MYANNGRHEFIQRQFFAFGLNSLVLSIKDKNKARDILEIHCNDFRNGENFHLRVLLLKSEIVRPQGFEAMITRLYNWLYSISTRLKENESIK